MKRALVLLAVALFALCAPARARADEASATLNALAAEQLIDCLTTMAVLRSGGFERNPIAAPFTHSALTQLGAAAALNLVARRFVPVKILRTVVNVYPVIILGNVRAMGAEGGMVTGGTAGALPPAVRHRPH